MAKDRLFLDTAFIQAVLNRRDQYHQQAIQLLPRLKKADEVWTTEAIFLEVGNALSSFPHLRQQVVEFIETCYTTPNIKVVTIDHQLFSRGLNLYKLRSDKSWGLVDCISFVVMSENEVMEALTADQHFIQGGFQILLG